MSLRNLCIAILLAGLLCACQREEVPGERVGLSITLLNYTDIPTGPVYVDDSWAGGAGPYGPGMGTAGGTSLPRQWSPDVKVTVEWSDDLLYQQDRKAWYRQEVPVERYGRIYAGRLYVAFFPGKQIKVFASGHGPGHPDFPDPDHPQFLPNPSDFCTSQPGCRYWNYRDYLPREGHY